LYSLEAKITSFNHGCTAFFDYKSAGRRDFILAILTINDTEIGYINNFTFTGYIDFCRPIKKTDNRKFNFMKQCVNRIACIIPDLKNKVNYNNSGDAWCNLTTKSIFIPSMREYIREAQKSGFYEFINKYVENRLLIVNNKIICYWIILHEYAHSLEKNIFNDKYERKVISELMTQSYSNENFQIYRELPSEKAADEFAFKFIEEHWDFLLPETGRKNYNG
jgi:hypothetical protein